MKKKNLSMLAIALAAPAFTAMAEFPASYTGTPYNGDPVTISATEATTIAAAAFDKGGQDVAFNYQNNGLTAANDLYRKDVDNQAMNTQTDGTIKNLVNGDWFNYTIDVQEAGKYKVLYNMSCADDGKKMKIFVDETIYTGAGEWGEIALPRPDASYNWDKYYDATLYVNLEAGKHLFTIFLTTGHNPKSLTFEKMTEDDMSYNGPHIIKTEGVSKLMAAEFDFGGLDVAYSYAQTNKTDNYRVFDKSNCNINAQGVIENNSGEDWYKYTIQVEKAGYYVLAAGLVGDGPSVGFNLALTTRDNIITPGKVLAPGRGWGYDNRFETVYLKPIYLPKGTQTLYALNPAGINWIYFKFRYLGSDDKEMNTVPGKVEAENYIADDGKYLAAGALNGEGKPYGNWTDYRGENQKVALGNFGNANDANHPKMVKDGHIQHINPGDYFTYSFICSEDNDYYVRMCLSVESEISETKVAVNIDGADGMNFGTEADPFVIMRKDLKHNHEWEASATGYNNYGVCDLSAGKVALSKGLHTMTVKFINAQCNFESVVFELEPEEAYNHTVIGADNDKVEFENYDESYHSYYWRQYWIGSNYRRATDVRTNKTAERTTVGNSDDGNYLTYNFTITEAGQYNFIPCVSPFSDHKFYLKIDDWDNEEKFGSKENPFVIPGFQSYSTYSEYVMDADFSRNLMLKSEAAAVNSRAAEPNELGFINFDAGEHTIVYHMPVAGTNFDYFRLEKVADFDDTLVGADNVKVDAKTGDGFYYTIDGVRHSEPVRGAINIHNGKKLYVK